MGKCSEWKATCNLINGNYQYAVYRLIDKNAVDHSGNREYKGVGYIDDKAEAEAYAAYLNSPQYQLDMADAADADDIRIQEWEMGLYRNED